MVAIAIKKPLLIVWWMISKNPPRTTQLCKGVQTSPYSGFICERAYIKDTDWSPSWILPEKLINSITTIKTEPLSLYGPIKSETYS